MLFKSNTVGAKVLGAKEKKAERVLDAGMIVINLAMIAIFYALI